MNYGVDDDGKFVGEMPDGDITHDEDEFYDAWAEEFCDFEEEGWM